MKSLARFWIVGVLVLVSGCSYEQAAKGTSAEAKSSQPAPPASETPAAATSPAKTDAGAMGATAKEVTLPNGLTYQDLRLGQGTVAKPGMKATVHYTGWLTNGDKFDSSKDRGTPFSFTLGRGEVIRGWDEGVQGMLVGGMRKLTIPAELGYGEKGYPGVIPPNATLIFDVELLDVQ